MKTRVLVADGDVAIRDIYQLHLEGYGYEVELAGDGLDCFAKLLDTPPAALVLESGLLWGGAEGVIARLRDEPQTRRIPVVLIANEDAPEDLAELVADPVVACLRKPFRMSALLQYLKMLE